MNKLIRDGKVAVLYSPGYGAGWSTWNQEYPEMVFDPGVVDLIENAQWDQLSAYISLKWPDLYVGGVDGLKIAWLPEGTAFKIEEHDGNEIIVIKEEIDWLIA
jgi:hypothetical protein